MMVNRSAGGVAQATAEWSSITVLVVHCGDEIDAMLVQYMCRKKLIKEFAIFCAELRHAIIRSTVWVLS